MVIVSVSFSFALVDLKQGYKEGNVETGGGTLLSVRSLNVFNIRVSWDSEH
jgi:hypothetical protein